jgi:hypothetical protein
MSKPEPPQIPVSYRFGLPKLNANGMHFSLKLAVGYAICSLLAYSLFRTLGIFGLVLFSVLAAAYYPKNVHVNWEEFWKLAIGFLILVTVGTVVAALSFNTLRDSGLLNFVFSSTFVELPIDRMSLEMLDSNADGPQEYAKILGRDFWQRYLPAANFSIWLESLGFGVCLSLLTTNRVCAYNKLNTARKISKVLVALGVLMGLILMAQMLGSSVIPQTLNGMIGTLTIAPFTWAAFLFFAALFHGLSHNFLK